LNFILPLEEKDLGCSYGIWWRLGNCFVFHTQRLRKLLKNILETQYVVQSFDGLWTVDFYFIFLDFYILYYKCFICSILNKDNNRILMKKQWICSKIVVFSKWIIKPLSQILIIEDNAKSRK